jgi:hypothetical protein
MTVERRKFEEEKEHTDSSRRITTANHPPLDLELV